MFFLVIGYGSLPRNMCKGCGFKTKEGRYACHYALLSVRGYICGCDLNLWHVGYKSKPIIDK